MDKIADDFINGQACSWRGVYFEREHGYPVICKNCWKKARKMGYTKEGLLKELGLQIAFIKEMD